MADICWIWANKIDNWASAIKMCTGHFWVFITVFLSGNFRWNQLWITGTVGKNQVLNEVFPTNLQYQYSRQSSYSNPSFIFIWEIYPSCKIEEKKNNFVWYGLKIALKQWKLTPAPQQANFFLRPPPPLPWSTKHFRLSSRSCASDFNFGLVQTWDLSKILHRQIFRKKFTL